MNATRSAKMQIKRAKTFKEWIKLMVVQRRRGGWAMYLVGAKQREVNIILRRVGGFHSPMEPFVVIPEKLAK